MRRLARHLFTGCCALCLLLSMAACVLWVRGRSGSDSVELTYDRWLPDRSAASTQVHLTSDKRIWVYLSWGQAPPYNGNLVYGYYIRADQSGGRPRLRFHHHGIPTTNMWLGPVDPDAGASGWGPLRGDTHARSMPTDGDNHHSIRIGISHWLAALLLLIPAVLWSVRFYDSRRARLRGCCRVCGYDLRATPQRCPECGTRATTLHP
jgi:hypothetical protein